VVGSINNNQLYSFARRDKLLCRFERKQCTNFDIYCDVQLITVSPRDYIHTFFNIGRIRVDKAWLVKQMNIIGCYL